MCWPWGPWGGLGQGPRQRGGRKGAELLGLPTDLPALASGPSGHTAWVPAVLSPLGLSTFTGCGGAREQERPRDLAGSRVGLRPGEQPVADVAECPVKPGRTSWEKRERGGVCPPCGSVSGAAALPTAVSVRGRAGEALWGQGLGQGPSASRVRRSEAMGPSLGSGMNELPAQAVFPSRGHPRGSRSGL